MSDSIGKLANPLGPGMPNPGTTGGAGPGGPPGGPIPMGPGNQLGGGGMPPAGSAGGPGPGLGMPNVLDGVRNTLKGRHGELRAAYDQLKKSLGQVDHMRKGLERLSDKGDMVKPDDVISEAGKLVAHGIDPMALAGVLADMPSEGGGEALGGWIVSHAIAAGQAEQHLLQAQNMVRSHLIASSIHMITAHDTGHMIAGPEPSGPADGGNALDQGGPASGNPLAIGVGGGQQA